MWKMDSRNGWVEAETRPSITGTGTRTEAAGMERVKVDSRSILDGICKPGSNQIVRRVVSFVIFSEYEDCNTSIGISNVETTGGRGVKGTEAILYTYC